MLIFFENENDFNVMNRILSAYEEKKKRELLVEGIVFNNIVDKIRKEMQIQKLTRAGYSSKHVRCHQCLEVWLALFEPHNTHVECPKCRMKIPIKQNKEHG